ncbi:MAG: hypothetical protein ACRDA3_10650 [Peptostreptococcaceae bacterium]
MNIDLKISKVASTECAQVGDTVKFISFIINTGDSNIDNIIFTDNPPNNTCFIPSTFRVNNQVFTNVNPKDSISLSTLLPNIFPLYPGDSIVIQYSVVIESFPTSNTIESTAIASVKLNNIDNFINKTYYSNINEIRIENVCVNNFVIK